jgi:hypothetical protein
MANDFLARPKTPLLYNHQSPLALVLGGLKNPVNQEDPADSNQKSDRRLRPRDAHRALTLGLIAAVMDAGPLPAHVEFVSSSGIIPG